LKLLLGASQKENKPPRFQAIAPLEDLHLVNRILGVANWAWRLRHENTRAAYLTWFPVSRLNTQYRFRVFGCQFFEKVICSLLASAIAASLAHKKQLSTWCLAPGKRSVSGKGKRFQDGKDMKAERQV
jgi:hypothetical protein